MDYDSFFFKCNKLFDQFKDLKIAIDSNKQFRSVDFLIKANSTKEIFNNDFIDVYIEGKATEINFRKDWIILNRQKGEAFPNDVLIENFIQLYPEKYLQGNPYKEKNKKAILFNAFFILNTSFEVETQQVDYLMPNMKKITTFFVNPDGTINKKEDELQLKKQEAKELETKGIKEIDFVIEEIKKINPK